MHCHPVFHVSLLEPYHENEFENRNMSNKRNIHLNVDYNEKIPNKIIDMRTYKGKNRYLVSWKGSKYYEDTWINEDQIPDKQLIQEYYKRTKKNKRTSNYKNYVQNETYSNEYVVRHREQPFVIELPSRRNTRWSSS